MTPCRAVLSVLFGVIYCFSNIEAQQCHSLIDVPYTQHRYNPEHRLEGSTVTTTCASGFVLVGPIVRLCRNSSWIPLQEPYCQQVCPDPPSIGSCGNVEVVNNLAIYTCMNNVAFRNTPHDRITCENGVWQGEQPRCMNIQTGEECGTGFSSKSATPTPSGINFVEANIPIHTEYDSCSTPPAHVYHSYQSVYPEPSANTGFYQKGTKVFYRCELGYELVGSKFLTCMHRTWQGTLPVCKSSSASCPFSNGHEFEHSYHELLENNAMSNTQQQYVLTGSRVKYYCYSGYHMTNGVDDVLIRTCVDGQWVGEVPVCEERQECSAPQLIAHGRWMYADMIPIRDNKGGLFTLGTRIHYLCEPGFELFGSVERTCNSGYWSDHEPTCLPQGMYCLPPGELEHGSHLCRHTDCNMYRLETEVHYLCDVDYQPIGEVIRSCRRGGVWSGPPPTCVHVNTTPMMYDSQMMPISTGTLTVVVAASCSVLGLLLLVLIVFFLQRHKARICRTGPSRASPSRHSSSHTRSINATSQRAPPSYNSALRVTSHPNESEQVEQTDNVALLPVLPSYEEATRRALNTSNHNRHLIMGGQADYCRLPSLNTHREPSIRSHPDYHRSSLVTMASSTMTHDNVTLTFGQGSVETMNISDGTSTTVTIDTYDSNASNPSITPSQRANVGSLGSSISNASVSTEDIDAPLITENRREMTTSRANPT